MQIDANIAGRRTAVEGLSVMSLLIEMQVGDITLAKGTGFVVQVGGYAFLVTNRHNVTGRHQDNGQPLSSHGGVPDRLLIHHNRAGRIGSTALACEPLYDGDIRPLWLEHPVLGPAADVVALPLHNGDNAVVYPYDIINLGLDVALGPTARVSVVGFPFGLTGGGALAIWATGFIASEPHVDFGGLPIFLIDCRTRQGQSGSPVIVFRAGGGGFTSSDGVPKVTMRAAHRFLGIYSGRLNAESDLGRVWKANVIREILTSGSRPQPA